MKFQNEFSVAASLEKTWETLLDIRRVAECIPGATLDSDGSDGVFRGRMRIKLGPMTVGYEGTAQMAEVEEDDHSATIEVRAKEVKGQGSASARIRNQLRDDGGVTQVLVSTDLSITGRPAQFGRGIMEDVATRMLEDFARRLEAEVSRAPATGNGAQPGLSEGWPHRGETASGEEQRDSVPADGSAGTTRSVSDGVFDRRISTAEPSPRDRQEPAPALDLGGVIAGPLAKRAVIAVATLFALAVLVLRLRRPRGLTMTISFR